MGAQKVHPARRITRDNTFIFALALGYRAVSEQLKPVVCQPRSTVAQDLPQRTSRTFIRTLPAHVDGGGQETGIDAL